MKIVITNDDGFGERGVTALERAIAPLADVIVVAPIKQHSACGHRVTMKKPLAVHTSGVNRFLVDGSPADCVRLAIKVFATDADWVVAGINPGANLGSDVYQSGTVAAAREAAVLGVKGIALSHYIGINGKIDWQMAEETAARVVQATMDDGLQHGEYVNINFPSSLAADEGVKIVDCPLDVHPHHYTFVEKAGVYHYQGIIHDRPRTSGSDVDVCFSGDISRTVLKL